MDDITKRAIKILTQNKDLKVADLAQELGMPYATLQGRLWRAKFTRKVRKQRSVSESQWKKIHSELESTLEPMHDIRKKYDLGYDFFNDLLRRKGYDIDARTKRVMSIKTTARNYQRSEAGAYKTTGTLSVLTKMQHKECLSGDGLSMLAHRLPLNEIAKVMQ